MHLVTKVVGASVQTCLEILRFVNLLLLLLWNQMLKVDHQPQA